MPRRSGYRVQLSVRLSEADKDFFCRQTEAAGLEPSVAVRQLLDLAIQRMRAGNDFIDVVFQVKNAWGVAQPSEIERRIAAAQRALAELRTDGDSGALLSTIEQIERQHETARRSRR